MALNSSLASVPGSSWPVRMPRIKLALERGELSSAGARRKIGHIRSFFNCERQAPQPLQSRAVAEISASVQWSCSVIGERTSAGVPPAAAGSAGGGAGSLSTRRLLVRACGSPCTTLPGLNVPAGSKIRLTSTNTSARGPYC